MQMKPEEYYQAPPDFVFNEIKAAATSIWDGYNDTRYTSEKLSRITPLENIGDNAWYIVAMFDQSNQSKLLYMVSEATAELIHRARGY